ncbi:hypothetical protein I5E97_06095 [Proteus hauseri]|uniref:hypothetical protein n=1 Tax=Proteus cibi TaxID=2050966 RepID=UPI0003C5DD33|nr:MULTISPECIES: hypothetical protein [Proteus]EST57411.1 hypothetical protein K151_2826 [Proteus hauseri ZMd44]MBG6030622.1 hypothetical protein [Proteus hauseri]
MAVYRDLEDHIIELFNSFNGVLNWADESYNHVQAYKPHPRYGGGECKTDVYVLLRNTDKNISSEIKISVKKDDADFLANKLTASVAEDLLGPNWSNILIENTKKITKKFKDIENLVCLKTRNNVSDAYFTLGWKLEVTNKERNLSVKLDLSNEEIIRVIFKGENQSIEKRNAIINGNIKENSGIAEYILYGNREKYRNAQSIIDDLINLEHYDAGDIYLVFTANNFRYQANKADGPRALAVAIEWLIKEGRLYPNFIFNQPLVFTGQRDMMPKIKSCLIALGINNFSDIDIEKIKPKI